MSKQAIDLGLGYVASLSDGRDKDFGQANSAVAAKAVEAICLQRAEIEYISTFLSSVRCLFASFTAISTFLILSRVRFLCILNRE